MNIAIRVHHYFFKTVIILLKIIIVHTFYLWLIFRLLVVTLYSTYLLFGLLLFQPQNHRLLLIPLLHTLQINRLVLWNIVNIAGFIIPSHLHSSLSPFLRLNNTFCWNLTFYLRLFLCIDWLSISLLYIHIPLFWFILPLFLFILLYSCILVFIIEQWFLLNELIIPTFITLNIILLLFDSI